ncbi:hypothetical protein [Desulfosporosinus nitroreducens]|uniref:Uncharacterized protein n=1 Tax=Desulfosporosinus nitroreducens TaxID=2018668 RepID=A0ABT8QPQ9_9FIRM|nr:hypothetical protein [Desulfosporosinus nitroreducens]MCO1603902.1 hypothetical protein [Desulfosporosinus nitroreducens]MDO0822600.1 hypothetical protein [Desulfosporosinus nitroreducens]
MLPVPSEARLRILKLGLANPTPFFPFRQPESQDFSDLISNSDFEQSRKGDVGKHLCPNREAKWCTGAPFDPGAQPAG